MTENEAIKELKEDCNELGKAIPCDTGWGVAINAAYSIAIKALEEIQQYRAIGTIEEFQKLKALFGNENLEISENATKILKEYPEYLCIGTIEEFKALKEKSVAKKDFSGCICNNVERERKEIRNKAIDEFVERVKEVYPFTILELEQLDKTANEMRCAE